jgi:hypothetical protein
VIYTIGVEVKRGVGTLGFENKKQNLPKNHSKSIFDYSANYFDYSSLNPDYSRSNFWD